MKTVLLVGLLVWCVTLVAAAHASLETTTASLESASLGLFDKKRLPACWKSGTARGTGTFPRPGGVCPPETPEKSAGFCYPQCERPELNEGLGPICWSKCRDKYPSNGMVFCCNNDETCSALLRVLGEKLPAALVQLGVDLATHPNDIAKILKDFTSLVRQTTDLDLPTC